MQIYRDGSTYTAVRITGPRHNFLRVTLKRGPVTHTNVYRDRISEVQYSGTLTDDDVLNAVLEGIQEANLKYRTHFGVIEIEFLECDSPCSSTYRHMAFTIVEFATQQIPN